jgi:hypothetical protein
MKIPVFATIGRAYGFTFGNLATIIGLVWLPLLLLLGGQYFVTVRYFEALEKLTARQDFSALGSAVSAFLLFAVAAVFLGAVMTAPVVRQALGERHGGAFIHFGAGATEFRLFGANLAFALMMLTMVVIAWVGIFVAVLGLGVAKRAVGTLTVEGIAWATLLAWSMIVFALAALAAFVFVLVRLAFFIAPVTVAERRIDLARGWTLTEGNFWRIFIVILATGIPIALVSLGLQWALLGLHTMMPGIATPVGGPVNTALRLHAIRDVLPITMGITLFLTPLQYGLTFGGAAAAYRALVPLQPPMQASAPPRDDLAPAAVAS